MKRRVGLVFEREADFSRFCLLLADEETPFALAGHRTVIVSENVFRLFDGPARQLAEKARRIDVQRTGKRSGVLPSRARAEELLSGFAKAR
jgi:hypothetical protein